MKVILIKDVARLGRRSELKEVPSGHALNFLIPRKLAVIATPENVKRLNEMNRKQEAQKNVTLQSFEEAMTLLASHTVQYSAPANEKGNLFKGVGADDIARQLQAEGFYISENQIVLEHPIKSLGIHTVHLKHEGVEGTCTLEVIKK